MNDSKNKGIEAICTLTPEQENAFNELIQAYNKCEALGILFVNIDAHLGAFDSSKVSNIYDDDAGKPNTTPIELPRKWYGYPTNLEIPGEWDTDYDTLYMHLTEKGLENYNSAINTNL